MKNKTFLDSIKCAFSGLFFGLKTEKNFKYYIGIALFFLFINFLCKVPIYGHITWLITSTGVFSSEFLNTTIEHLSNALTKEIRNDIKVIKDMAATSVLIWGFAFFISEFIILIGTIL